jgi:hypothetical protein
VQELRDDADLKSARATSSSEAARVLEDSYGVKWLHVGTRTVGKVSGHKGSLEFESIVWHPIVSMRLLQGASIPDATGLVLVAGEHRPLWHPEPGVDHPRFSGA